MRLIYEKSKAEVRVGDIATTFRGESVQVVRIEEPRHAASTGRVYVRDWDAAAQQATGPEDGIGYYPGVICAEWIERLDQL